MQIADVRMMNENGKPHSVTLLDGSLKMISNWIFGQQEFLVACLLLGGVFNWDSRINTQKCLGHPPPVVYTKESQLCWTLNTFSSRLTCIQARSPVPEIHDGEEETVVSSDFPSLLLWESV